MRKSSCVLPILVTTGTFGRPEARVGSVGFGLAVVVVETIVVLLGLEGLNVVVVVVVAVVVEALVVVVAVIEGLTSERVEVWLVVVVVVLGVVDVVVLVVVVVVLGANTIFVGVGVVRLGKPSNWASTWTLRTSIRQNGKESCILKCYYFLDEKENSQVNTTFDGKR